MGTGTFLFCSPWSVLSPGSFFLGILIPVLIGWIPFRMRAVGAGDIKLFMAVGCLNGGEDVLYSIFLSFLLGAGISLGRLLSLKQLKISLIQCFRYFIQMVMQKKIERYPGAGGSIAYDPLLCGNFPGVYGMAGGENLQNCVIAIGGLEIAYMRKLALYLTKKWEDRRGLRLSRICCRRQNAGRKRSGLALPLLSGKSGKKWNGRAVLSWQKRKAQRKW